MTTELWAVGGVLAAAFFAAAGSLYFKKGAGKLSLSINALIKNLELLTGVVFYGISTVIFIVSLRGGELSVLYPIAASSYIWVVVFSIKFLGERMDKSKWLGIGLIVAGVSLIGLGAV